MDKKTINKINSVIITIVVFLMCIVVSIVLTTLANKSVLINTYKITSPISITTNNSSNVSTHTISFTDESGNTIIIENAAFEGYTTADSVYVYRIGKWEWMSKLRYGAKYIVKTNGIDNIITE